MTCYLIHFKTPIQNWKWQILVKMRNLLWSTHVYLCHNMSSCHRLLLLLPVAVIGGSSSSSSSSRGYCTPESFQLHFLFGFSFLLLLLLLLLLLNICILFNNLLAKLNWTELNRGGDQISFFLSFFLSFFQSVMQ